MKINRENFLHILESVSAGLTTRAVVQNSDCFTFAHGWVYTGNEEITCRMPSGLHDSWQVTVPGQKLLDILRALDDEELRVAIQENLLIFRGQGKSRLRTQADVFLVPIEYPKTWQSLPNEFAEALLLVYPCCAGKSIDNMASYVCLDQEAISATDRFQAAHYRLILNLDQCLISKQAARQITTLGFTGVAQTVNWLHFRNHAGLELSCRCHRAEFPALATVLQQTGQPVTLPKNLLAAIRRGHIFSKENTEGDKVLVRLSRDRLHISGAGVHGDHGEPHDIAYAGPPIAFLIAPEHLSDILSRHNDWEISEKFLKVTAGPYTYITWLQHIAETPSC